MALSIEEQFKDKREFVRKVLAGDERAVVLFNQSYDAAVARFMKLKETVVEKVYRLDSNYRYDLYFDLQESRKIIWDILFLAELIKSECSTDPDKKNKLEQSLKSKYNLVNFTNSSASALSNVRALEVVPSDDGKSLEDVLKEAICIFDSIRNSFGHNEGGLDCYYDETNNKVNIKNQPDGGNNYMDVSIDFSYLADFGCGIKPLSEHTGIKEVVDYNNAAIFEKMGFKIKDNLDIFYRTSPDRVNYLLNLVDNSYERLVDLPTILFSSSVSEERITDLLEDSRNINNIVDLPSAVFYSRCSKKRLLQLCRGEDFGLSEEQRNSIDIEKYINEYKFDESDIETLKLFPDSLFLCSDAGLKVFYYLLNMGVDVNDLQYYSFRLFLSKTITLDKLEYFVNLDGEVNPENLLYLNKNILSNESILNDTVKRIISSKDDLIYIFNLPCIPHNIWSYYSTKVVLPFLFEYTEDWRKFFVLPNIVFTPNCELSRLELLLDNFTVDFLSLLPEYIFSSKISDKKVEWLIDSVNDFDDLVSLPAEFLGHKLDLLKMYVGPQNDFSRLLKLPKGMFDWDVNLKILKYIFDIPYDNDKDIVEYIFNNDYCLYAIKKFPENVFKILVPEQFGRVNFDTDGMSHDELKVYKDADFCLHERHFEKLKLILGEPKSSSNLFDLDLRIFNTDYSIDKIKHVLGENNDLSNLRKLFEPKYKAIVNIVLSPSIDLDMLLLIGNGKLDFDSILAAPKVFDFYRSYDYVKSWIELVGGPTNLSILNTLPFSAFYVENDVKVEYFLGEDKNYQRLSLIPSFCFDSNCSLDRIKLIMGKIDNDYSVLNKLPKEIFFCNDNLVTDLLEKYNDVSVGIQKSIFGLNDDKVISLIIYLNSLLSITSKNNILNKKINIEAFDFSNVQYFSSPLLENGANEINSKLNDCFNNTGSFAKLLEDYSFENKFADISSMTNDELEAAYNQWENEVRAWLFSSVFKICSKLYTSTRNSAEHIRIFCDSDGKILVLDQINKMTDSGDGTITKDVKNTFYAEANVNKLFNFASSVHDWCFNNEFVLDSVSEKNIIKNVLLKNDDTISEDDFEKMYLTYLAKINTFIESVRMRVVDVYNSRNYGENVNDMDNTEGRRFM